MMIKSLWKRATAALLSSVIMATSVLSPEFFSLTAHAVGYEIDNDNSYVVTLYWRDDQNSKNIGSEYIKVENEDIDRLIYMGIYVNNRTTTALYPGEFELTFDGLNGLKRGEENFCFVEDDSVFSQNWIVKNHTTTVVDGIPHDTYTIVNQTPISNERISTLFWRINSREAVSSEYGQVENIDSNGEMLLPFERSLPATYQIIRLSRNAENELIDGTGNVIVDLSGFVMKKDQTGADTAFIDASDGYVHKTDGTKYNEYGYRVDENGDVWNDTYKLTWDDDWGAYYAYDADLGMRIAEYAGYTGTDIAYLNVAGELVNASGQYVRVDLDSNTLIAVDHPLSGDVVPQCALPCAGIPLITYVSNDGSPTAPTNDDLTFSYSTKRDPITVNVQANPLEQTGVDDLHEGYEWCKYDADVNQSFRARGLSEYSYYIDIEIPTEYSGYYDSDPEVLHIYEEPETDYTVTVTTSGSNTMYKFFNSKGDEVTTTSVAGRFVKDTSNNTYYKVENTGEVTAVIIESGTPDSLSLDPQDIILIDSKGRTLSGTQRQWITRAEDGKQVIRIQYPEYTDKAGNINEIDYYFNIGVDKQKIGKISWRNLRRQV